LHTKYVKWLIIVGISLVVVFLFLPRILSLPLFKGLFLSQIRAKTHTEVSAAQIQLSWLGPQKIEQLQMHAEEFQGSVEHLTIGAPLWAVPGLFRFQNLNQIKGELKLEGGTFIFGPDIQVEGVRLSLKSTQGIAHFVASGNTFSLEGTISSPSEFSINGSLSSFPTLPLARYLELRFDIDESSVLEIIGARTDLNGSTAVHEGKGFVDLSLRSSNITCTLLGDFTEELLTLQQPLTATVRLTPRLSELLLRNFSPLFLTGLEAKNPIQLRIEPVQFRCPLSPFSLRTLQIEQGTLSMGKIRAKNGASLASLISILKNQRLSRTQEMNVWFSSMPFRLRNGLLSTGRMDALVADSLHICTWGDINLIDEQLHLYLGLTAQVLDASFGIKNLRSDYVMKIPVTGSLKTPKIATESAAVKIAALKASQTALKDTFPGKLLEMLLPNEEGVPPPHRPFPWE
jgi:hypothetical protein